MPLSSCNLDVNVRVSVNKRFINNYEAKEVLCIKNGRSTPLLSFQRKTISQSAFNYTALYDVILDDVPGIVLSLKQGCLKYLGTLGATVSNATDIEEVHSGPLPTENAIQEQYQVWNPS